MLLERLRDSDPDRFLAVMAVPPGARDNLAVLYAFNLELARAPWVSAEPLIARMRLQFWRDVVADPQHPRAHEVAGPLAAVIRDCALPGGLLNAMIAARETEAERGHLSSFDQLCSYVADSSGSLMALAARTLGSTADEVAIGYGSAQGIANYLMAVPQLEASGRAALPDGDDKTIRDLAEWGLKTLAIARNGRANLPPLARPALLAAWRAKAILAQAAADPASVREARLVQSEFVRRGSLLWASLAGL